jgi:hypothetical protein
LTAGFNQIVGGSAGVALAAIPGAIQTVANYSPSTINVYPAANLPALTWNQQNQTCWGQLFLTWSETGQASINSQTAGQPYSLASSSVQTFYCFSETVIYCGAAAPVILSITPDSCYLSGNTYIVITGVGLTSITNVFFGNVPSQYVFIKSDTELHVSPFPVSSAQTVTLTLTSPYGITSTPFTFVAQEISGTLTFYSKPANALAFTSICTGNDGNLWWGNYAYLSNPNGFTMTPENTNYNPFYLTGGSAESTLCDTWGWIPGSGGNIWAVDRGNLVLWKIPPSLSGITPFSLPGAVANFQYPQDVCVGADGAFYVISSAYTSSGNIPAATQFLWRVTDPGVVTTFMFSLNISLNNICNAPNGNLWITWSDLVSKTGVMEVTTGGVLVNKWTLNVPNSGTLSPNNNFPFGLVSDGIGNLWCGYWSTTDAPSISGLAKIPTSNPTAASYYQIYNNRSSVVCGLCVGPDGNIYCVGGQQGYVSDGCYFHQVTPNGAITPYEITNPAPQSGDTPIGVCVGSNGYLYATYFGNYNTDDGIHQLS